MLKMRDPLPVTTSIGGPAESAAQPFDLASIRGILERQWPLIVAAVLAALVLAAAYVLTSQPSYTATGQILIDTRKNQLLRNQLVSEAPADAGMVESQIQIIKSEATALAVIRKLNLLEDSEFTNPRSNLLQMIAGYVGLAEDISSPEVLERRAVNVFTRNVNAKRVNLSYVIEISYRAQTPQKAATIANSIAGSYMLGELEARYEATKRASEWLQSRINELREQATRADLAVQRFKAENNIVGTNRGLMSEQQLADLNSQLVLARAVTAEAKARLDRISEISRGDVPDATVTDALRSDVITRLRAQFLDLSNRQADFSTRFGPNHAATVNLQNQMRDVQRSIADEVRRIAETYRSDYEIARSREESLQRSLAELVGEAGTTNQAQVTLRDLESSAQTYRSLYDNFLRRFGEASQQEDLPINEARILKAATEPFGPSGPNSTLVLGAAAFVGLCVGFAGAWGREYLNRVFRTVSDVERIARVECLGILPTIDRKELKEPTTPSARGASGSPALLVPPMARYAVTAPFSRYAETLRNVKVSTDIARLSRDVRIIGVVSSLPEEGKTTVSSNLAHLIAQTGQRTLLIDADLRNPSLTRTLAPRAGVGLMDILVNSRPLQEVILREPSTGLDFLPASVKGRMSYTSELISSAGMERLLQEARDTYDYVILDLPPIVPIVDVKAASHLIDAFVFVIEWGESSHEVVKEALSSADLVAERMIGAVLNKADPTALKRLETYKGRHYNNYYLKDSKKA